MTVPENTILGKLEIIEVYEFYDEPLLFACRNASDATFIAVLADEDDESNRWLYAAVSKRRLELIRSGAIDLHSAFSNTEDGFVFLVNIPIKGEEPVSVNVQNSATIGEDLLPLPDTRLNLATATLPELDKDLSRMAQQTNRDIFRLSFDYPNRYRTEAPAKSFGKILEALQNAINAIGDKLHGEGHLSGAIPNDILSELELSVIAIGPGSFKVDLASSDLTNLFGESNIGDALEVLLFLLKLEDEEDDLKEQLLKLQQRVTSKYLAFLKTIKNDITGTNFDLASPKPERRGNVYLSTEKVNRIINIIELFEEQPPVEIQVIGDLIGASLSAKNFEIWTSKGGAKYSGKITDEAMESVQNATLSKRYLATILEETKIKPMIEEGVEIKHTLLKLEPYKPKNIINEPSLSDDQTQAE